MAPTRTSHSTSQNEAEGGPSKTQTHPRKHRKGDAGATGVQKLKSSLRQTRRLLAKDNLAADVRVETERRLKALEADLVQAESSKKERTLAVRYHKIKFFERQKVVRKLTQVKKRKAAEDDPALDESLFALRVDLNYILHYPKTKKYISLFPPEVREGEPQSHSGAEMDKTTTGREEVKSWIRERMSAGKLSAEPELHLDVRSDRKLHSGEWDGRGEGGDASRKPTKSKKTKKDARLAVDEDMFFGVDE
ncbi:hypothetical protein BD779DRAFT_1662784 [Infundibulicybe gibba]|nr:hypothetical protein BD779DRAFT_1662784 [Infundibulicybe gibba]